MLPSCAIKMIVNINKLDMNCLSGYIHDWEAEIILIAYLVFQVARSRNFKRGGGKNYCCSDGCNINEILHAQNIHFQLSCNV